MSVIVVFLRPLGLPTLETCPIVRSSIDCININTVEKYFSSKSIVVNDENKLLLMESASIITKEKETSNFLVTLGGLLVFCDINSVYIPHNMVRIVNKVNKSFEEIIIIQGNLLQMIYESEKVLKALLPAKYPYYAVLEGVKNAILYRDYSIFYKEIEVVIGINSVSVISPGNLINNNKVVDKYNNYFKRNMWIYEKLITLDDTNIFTRSGRGFSVMKKAFKNYGKVMFINSFENDSFKVIYPGITSFK